MENLQEITVHILEEPRYVAEGKTPAIQAINENMEDLRSAAYCFLYGAGGMRLYACII